MADSVTELGDWSEPGHHESCGCFECRARAQMRSLAPSAVVSFNFDRADAMALVGLVQLALRHPDVAEQTPRSAAWGRNLVNAVALSFPELAPVIELGWQA